MKKIEAVIRPNKLNEVKDVLDRLNVGGMTVSEVLGYGQQKGQKQIYRGMEYNVQLLPKLKLEIVVLDDQLESVVAALMAATRTGEIGDGKIFVYDLENAYRVRTGEQGETAI